MNESTLSKVALIITLLGLLLAMLVHKREIDDLQMTVRAWRMDELSERVTQQEEIVAELLERMHFLEKSVEERIFD